MTQEELKELKEEWLNHHSNKDDDSVLENGNKPEDKELQKQEAHDKKK